MFYKVSKFSLHIFAILFVCFSIISGTTYWFLKKTPYSPITFKTNSIQTIITTREHIFSNLWEGFSIYFWNKYLPTWQKGIEPTPAQKKEQRKLFHYNLRIEHIIDHDQHTHANHERPTIFFHGWGDTKNSAKLLKAFTDVLPGDIITFHFHDRGVIIPKLRHSNLGQLPDVLTGLYVIKWARHMLHLNAVDLYGYSRGGATIFNLIGILNDTSGKYDRDLLRIGIDAAERKKLLAMIQAGCIVLDCPLTDANVSGELLAKKFTSHASGMIKAFTRLSKYEPNGLQGLQSTNLFKGLKLNILLHFQYHDTIVSNQNEAELYRRLYTHNPKTTYVVLGNDGGHMHTHASLAHTIHTFKKMHGSAYDKLYDAQYEAMKQSKSLGTSSIGTLLLQPGKTIDAVIADYYDGCQKINTHKIDRYSK